MIWPPPVSTLLRGGPYDRLDMTGDTPDTVARDTTHTVLIGSTLFE